MRRPGVRGYTNSGTKISVLKDCRGFSADLKFLRNMTRSFIQVGVKKSVPKKRRHRIVGSRPMSYVLAATM